MANSVSIDGYLHFEGYDNLPRDFFDKKKIRAGMRKAGAVVRREARALVNKRGASSGSDYPSRDEGLLYRGIRAKVSRSGFLAKIAPQKITGMKDFYPAYLGYGVKRGARLSRLKPGEKHSAKRRREGIRLRKARRNNDWLIEPRGNYMADALQNTKSDVQAILSAAFAAALS
ncbi:hypothetical protein GHO41_07270 [Pseudomonas sp. FSL R10-0399]|uniref:hypothetical protein n=1 Tax=Pseudomonas sp. FSL R10-0399 TaxID=2662194 RepID=UPI001297EEBF|nr:hypothetical protein [Pseudomonas sp. FSL R10-0399]MQT57148.1 hypothetical protein [Pseudomonas sp. FSL R10-0399]